MDYLYNSFSRMSYTCYNHAVLVPCCYNFTSVCGIMAVAGNHLLLVGTLSLEADMAVHTLSPEVYTMGVGQNIVVGFGETLVVLVVRGIVAVIGLPEVL